MVCLGVTYANGGLGVSGQSPDQHNIYGASAQNGTLAGDLRYTIGVIRVASASSTTPISGGFSVQGGGAFVPLPLVDDYQYSIPIVGFAPRTTEAMICRMSLSVPDDLGYGSITEVSGFIAGLR